MQTELNPNLEVARKLQTLNDIKSNFLIFIGAINYISTYYDQLSHVGIFLTDQLANQIDKYGKNYPTFITLMFLNQKIFEDLVERQPRTHRYLLRDEIDGEFSAKKENKKSFRTAKRLDLEDLGDLSSVTNINNAIDKLMIQLKDNSRKLNEFVAQTRIEINQNKRPNRFSRRWMRFLVFGVVTSYISRSIYNSRQIIMDSIYNLSQTFVNFVHRYLETPLMDIYKTIRYDSSNFSFMNEKALNLEVEDLAKMMIQFARRQNANLSAAQVQQLMEMAKQGDLSTIMKVYDDLIQSPIKNAIFGDLIELLLIQVQKQKVDVEKALLVLDKLMKSNG